MEDVRIAIRDTLNSLKEEERKLLSELVKLENSLLNQKFTVPREELMKLVEDCIK